MKEIIFGITDGDWIYADGAKHHLWQEDRDFDIYYSSNARETIYVVLEYPQDRDFLVKLTSVDYQSMDPYEIVKYVKKQIADILEKFNA